MIVIVLLGNNYTSAASEAPRTAWRGCSTPSEAPAPSAGETNMNISKMIIGRRNKHAHTQHEHKEQTHDRHTTTK